MLMPAMLFTTSCSNEDVVINGGDNAKMSKKITVTVNVTRQGDNAGTRATFSMDSKKLSFSDGDQLFVNGESNEAGHFAGTLTWQSGGSFSGDIHTQEFFTGTADELLSDVNTVKATLLPAGWDGYEFLKIKNDDGDLGGGGDPAFDYLDDPDYTCAVASNLYTAIEQFSLEQATAYSGGFTLAPQNAIVNFTYTITTIHSVSECYPYLYSPSISTDDCGGGIEVEIGEKNIATFAIAVKGGLGAATWTLSDWSYEFTDVNLGEKNIVAGKIYNVSNVAPVDLSTLTDDYLAVNGETLTGDLEGEYQIFIAAGATVTLAGVNIDPVYVEDCAGITWLGNATIILKDGTDNYVWGDSDYAGIFVPDGSTLIIDGGGSLETGSVYAAGIGGNRYADCGNIIIKGGTIEAKGSGGAGIGSGPDMSCGNITITGGNITAQGNNLNGFAAGIGTGNHGECGDIVISGGTVTATGGYLSAGIGGGCNGYCSNITIYNTVTKVTATKGTDAYCSIGLGDEDVVEDYDDVDYNFECTVTIGGENKGYGVEESPYVYQPQP
jgi:hypothetical protein